MPHNQRKYFPSNTRYCAQNCVVRYALALGRPAPAAEHKLAVDLTHCRLAVAASRGSDTADACLPQLATQER
jgi:hypothetical protein